MASPGRVKLPLILLIRVAVNGDDANSRAWCVGDDDWLGDGSTVRRTAAVKTKRKRQH